MSLKNEWNSNFRSNYFVAIILIHLCYNLRYPEMLRVMYFFRFILFALLFVEPYCFLFFFVVNNETVKSNLIIFRVDRNTVGLVKNCCSLNSIFFRTPFFSSTSDITNFCFVQIPCCCFCSVNNETFMNLKILYLIYDTSVFRT